MEQLPLTAKEEELVSSIRAAGEILLRYWPGARNGDDRGLGIQEKGDGSPVTEADLASNDMLVSTISALFPNDRILSEETIDSLLAAGKPNSESKDRVWIIDPLDGTKSFIHGDDDFSILVALVENQQPILGFMFFPARDEFAIGRLGQGAWLNGKRLAVSSNNEPREHSLYLRHLAIGADQKVYPKWMDSGCALLSVCRGELDGAIIRIVNHREWDLAAPALIISESGGKVSDESGAPIAFDKMKGKTGTESMGYTHFIVSNGGCHDRLRELIVGSTECIHLKEDLS